MLTLRVFVRVLILVCECAFCCQCAGPPEQQKKCYEVGSKTICFFRPELENKRTTRSEAWLTCHKNNATLPVIVSVAAQEAFESYLQLVDRGDFWMAGQEVKVLEWKWSNGTTANLKGRQLNGKTGDDYVQGVLTKDMSYNTEVPNKPNHFFCQLNGTGIACRFALSNGCLLLNSKEALNLYDARNRCVKDGGDLPVIDNPGDLSRFREIITLIPNVAKVWIGLRRQWWDWIGTVPDVEMKYSNWLPNHGFNRNGSCLIAGMKEYKWQQVPCSSLKLFFCQTVVNTSRYISRQSNSVLNSISAIIIFAALGISIPVVSIFLVVIVKKRRKARQRQQVDVRGVPSDRSYQDLLHQENNYMELKGIIRQHTELNSDYQNISE